VSWRRFAFSDDRGPAAFGTAFHSSASSGSFGQASLHANLDRHALHNSRYSGWGKSIFN
jgi:hypothetical protein